MSFARQQMSPAFRRLPTAILLVSLCFTAGCVRRGDPPPLIRAQANSLSDDAQPTPRININTASAEELEKLPGIGQALAARIIEHRGKFGPFRRPEHLIMVRGISDKRFRALQKLITVDD